MPTEYILNNLNSEVSCFCGSVYGDSLRRVREESDVLIIVESFDKKYKNLLSTALSTKVPEYLASGKIILAIGPDYSAAISYIRANNAGYCLTSIDKRDILNMLDLILQDNLDNKMRKIQNALRLARSRHNTTEVSLSIMREIEKII